MSQGIQYVKLNNGHKMPLVGIGTYTIIDYDTIYNVLDKSFQFGLRSIDTAEVYRNEQNIGEALNSLLPKHNLTREDIFITTKLDPSHNGNPTSIKKSIQESLNKLNTDYIDLYLIHWPGTSGQDIKSLDNPKNRDITWKTLTELHKTGVLRSIGVSNYTITHLKQLLNNSYGIKPALNQVELHPFLIQKELRNFCQMEEIFVQAHSSLGSSKCQKLLTNPTICSIANELNVSPARLLLKWALQQDIGIIPKAVNEQHIEDNSKLDFHINASYMNQLSELPSERFSWNPEVVV